MARALQLRAMAADNQFMGVGPVSGGASSPALDSAVVGLSASTQTAMAMMGTAMDTQAQMMAMLLRTMQAGNPAGVGGSVNTYA